jgi:hypothetical protein
LILDEGNTEKSHGMATAALQASEEFLKESKRVSEAFHATPPTSRWDIATVVYYWARIDKFANNHFTKISCGLLSV